MESFIVGICGPQGAGKTILGQNLFRYANTAEIENGPWGVDYFAKPLYRIVEILCVIPEGMLDKSKEYTVGDVTKTGRE